MTKNYDVVIIGAGPAGSGCALALRNSGLKVALIDKEKFPRNKTCGDAIPGPALKYLKEILQESLTEFENFGYKQKIKSSVIFVPDSGSIEVNWKLDAYNSKRFCFDNFLLDLVKKHSDTAIYEGLFVDNISKSEQGIKITAKNSDLVLSCDMIIGGDGANSIVSRVLSDNRSAKSNYVVALSAYFKDVDSPDNTNNFFLLKDILGYFWIFPVNGNTYNVGFANYKQLRSSKPVNIEKYFHEIIAEHPVISKKFSNAKIVSDIRAFRLPFQGGDKIDTSGERFLLTGDAARLVDPMGGHGIDNAIKSGMLAAQHIENCFMNNNFSSAFNAKYDAAVYTTIGKNLKRNFQMIKLLSRFPWLLKLFYLLIKYYNNLLRLSHLSNKKWLKTKYKAY